jgi:hypothetical protein
MASLADSTDPSPVMMIISEAMPALRMRENSSRPSTCGMRRSARTTPYPPCSASFQAALPSVAVSTS